MIKELVIYSCLLLICIAGFVVICSVPMPHFIGAAIGIFSTVFAIASVIHLWAVLDGDDDDDDGPHSYGPGGTII